MFRESWIFFYKSICEARRVDPASFCDRFEGFVDISDEQIDFVVSLHDLNSSAAALRRRAYSIYAIPMWDLGGYYQNLRWNVIAGRILNTPFPTLPVIHQILFSVLPKQTIGKFPRL